MNARTVNNVGQWTPFETLEEYAKVPKAELCQMDEIAIAVLNCKGDYEIQTNLENVCYHISLYLDEWRDGDEDTPATAETVIREFGGLQEFDYYC